MRGRHRNLRVDYAVKSVAAVAVLAVLLGTGWLGYHLISRPSCTSRMTVNLAAAPEIAPVIQVTANQWSAAHSTGSCVRINVTAGDPADVAAVVAGQRGATLAGIGEPNGKVAVPDVWIPDSSTWLSRLRAMATDLVPAEAPSVAESPVVLAMPVPVAQALGWPGTHLTWSTVLEKMLTGGGLRAGIVEPARDASGLSGLLALASVSSAAGANGQQLAVAALRALATGKSTLRDDLLGRFPRAADPTTLASSLGAAPLPEQAVISYNAAQPPVPLAGVFMSPEPPALDYPYAVLPGTPPEVAAAAKAFGAALAGPGYRGRLAQHGLRDANGTPGPGFSFGPGSPPTLTATPAVNQGTIDQTLSTWSAVTQPGRMLAVIDVSGSMITPVPTAGGATREQVTVAAAQNGLKLFDDTWVLGLWVFSTEMDGATPYRQLVPMAPLANNRNDLTGALIGIRPKINGNTGLYDTVLAAYKTVQAGWDPGRVNSVLIMTDGQNDNPGGLTLDQLTAQLQKIADPRRPIEVIAVGIGTDVSQPELSRITQTTGGGVFIASDPGQIGQIFLRAIALRPR